MEPKSKDLTAREQAFVNEYVITLNKTSSALAAGLSPKTAKQQGWAFYNRSHVKAAIEKLLQENTMTAGETLRRVSKIAEHDMADYFSPVQKLHTTKIKVGLQHIIDRIQKEIDFEDLYRSKVEMTEEANDAWFLQQQDRRDRKLRYELELELNPNATRIIDGETEIVEVMELDINKLIEARERGQIKGIKYGPNGIQIEGYSALDAQDKLLRVHGKFEKDNEQSKPAATMHIFQLPDNGR